MPRGVYVRTPEIRKVLLLNVMATIGVVLKIEKKKIKCETNGLKSKE